MKAFLLFRRGSWDSPFGGYPMRPKCVVLANSLEEAAEKVGGRFQTRTIEGEEEDVVIFPKALFTPTKKDSEYFKAGELLEYRSGPLYLTILPG